MGRKAIQRKRKKNKEKTKEWIKILLPYFQKNGLRGMTMDLVAQELNKSKTTVYDYFQTKEELLRMMVTEKLGEVKGFEKILKDASLSFIDRCYEVLKFLADHISDISNLFLTDLKALYPNLWKKIEDFLDYTVSVLEAFYQQGIEAGAFNRIHTAILAVNDQLFFRKLTDPDFLTDHDLTLQEAFNQYSKLKFFGLIKEKSDDFKKKPSTSG